MLYTSKEVIVQAIVRLRAIGALMLGLCITTTTALGLVVTGVPYRLLVGWWAARWFQNPLRLVPTCWARIMEVLCSRWLMRIQVHTSGTLPTYSSTDRVLCLANHPPGKAIPSFFRLITSGILPRVAAIGKQEHLWNPIGWAMWAIQAGILINRKNRTSAIDSIRRGLADVFTPGTCLVLFPDMRRPMAKRIASDRKKFKASVPGVAEWLHYTMVPRSGGLAEILKVLREVEGAVRIVDVTLTFNVDDGGAGDMSRIFGATLYLHVEEIPTPLPHEPALLQDWLNSRWKWKNEWIRAQRAQ